MSNKSLQSNCDGNQVDFSSSFFLTEFQFMTFTPDGKLVAREICLISTTQIKFNKVDS